MLWMAYRFGKISGYLLGVIMMLIMLNRRVDEVIERIKITDIAKKNGWRISAWAKTTC